MEAGIDLPTPNGGWIGPKEYPINAGQWADPDFEIDGWVIVQGKPRSGDVIALSLNGSNYTGHVGIVVGGRAYLSTISTNGGSIVTNNWGFRHEHKIKL